MAGRRRREETVKNMKVKKNAIIGECTEKRKCILLVEISDCIAFAGNSIDISENT